MKNTILTFLLLFFGIKGFCQEISWLQPVNIKSITTQSQVEIKFELPSEQVKDYALFLDGQPYLEKVNSKSIVISIEDIEEDIEYTTVKLVIDLVDAGEHELYIVSGANESKKIIIDYQPTEVNGTVYIIGLGANEYKFHPKYNLDFPDDDVNAFVDLFKDQKDKELLYRNKEIKTTILTGPDATRTNFFRVINNVKNSVKTNDLVIVFISAHGKIENDTYYLLTYDYEDGHDYAAIEYKWLKDNAPKNTLMFVDACQSGAIAKSKSWTSEKDLTKVIKYGDEMLSSNGNITFYLGSSSETGLSYEYKPWGHGIFTKAILDLYKGVDFKKINGEILKAPRANITLAKLEKYVKERTQALAKEINRIQIPHAKQTPGKDFPLFFLPITSEQEDDADNDGILDAVDCRPDDRAFPSEPGTPCDDRDAMTIQDKITEDGCDCKGILDSDGDEVPDADDCEPFNALIPAPIGKRCDDGKKITINDIIQADGCTCKGELDSDGDKILDEDDCKPYDANFPGIVDTPCDDGNTLTINDKYVEDGCSCEGDLDTDGDGILDIDDCSPKNPNLPEKAGTPCNDGDAYTINDVRLEDGCGCKGEQDSDKDGIIDIEDCQPNDAQLPGRPGAACDDKNYDTIKDRISKDGCSCSGKKYIQGAYLSLERDENERYNAMFLNIGGLYIHDENGSVSFGLGMAKKLAPWEQYSTKDKTGFYLKLEGYHYFLRGRFASLGIGGGVKAAIGKRGFVAIEPKVVSYLGHGYLKVKLSFGTDLNFNTDYYSFVSLQGNIGVAYIID